VRNAHTAIHCASVRGNRSFSHMARGVINQNQHTKMTKERFFSYWNCYVDRRVKKCNIYRCIDFPFWRRPFRLPFHWRCHLTVTQTLQKNYLCLSSEKEKVLIRPPVHEEPEDMFIRKIKHHSRLFAPKNGSKFFNNRIYCLVKQECWFFKSNKRFEG
jgi:hypothetical protein